MNRRGRASTVWVGAIAAVIAMVACSGCRQKNENASTTPGGQPKRVSVVVSIPPLKRIVQDMFPVIQGYGVDVTVLTPVGAMEHGYEIPPAGIATLMNADLVVYVGVGLDPQVEKILKEHPSTSRLQVCFAEAVGIETHGSEAAHDDHDHHEHADDHDHEHGTDPHLWLDPALVRQLVVKLAPDVATVTRRAWVGAPKGDLEDQLAGRANEVEYHVLQTDRETKGWLDPYAGQVLVTAHAAWGRYAARYRLEPAPLGGLEATEPSPDAVAKAMQLIKDRNVQVIFTEPQINPATMKLLAEKSGIRVLSLDPLGSGDWYEMMARNRTTIVEGFSDGKK